MSNYILHAMISLVYRTQKKICNEGYATVKQRLHLFVVDFNNYLTCQRFKSLCDEHNALLKGLELTQISKIMCETLLLLDNAAANIDSTSDFYDCLYYLDELATPIVEFSNAIIRLHFPKLLNIDELTSHSKKENR